MLSKSVCVLGLGYIGLPTASLLATKGYQVLGVDVDQKVIDTINQGRIHIIEPGLDVLVKSAVHSGNLTASLSPLAADVFIIAVPTPFDKSHKPNLSYIKSAAQSIAPYLQEGNMVILESTSPVGSTELVKATIDKYNPNVGGVYYAHCPERVIPGRVLEEIVGNDRIVGGLEEESTRAVSTFYQAFVQGEVLETDARTAELCKLTENAFRDVNIAYANELSFVCDQLGVNVWELVELANRHPRVNILKPGPGVGGHCIAVDPWFIVSSAPEVTKLIQTARLINDAKPQWVIDRVKEKAGKFKNPVISCLGVTFKADIDDVRESPALKIAETLKGSAIGELLICEPNLTQLDGFDLVDLKTALQKADIIVILVDHKSFQALSKETLLEKCVIDTKGVLS